MNRRVGRMLLAWSRKVGSALVIACGVLTPVRNLDAQQNDATAGRGDWLERWSPLRPINALGLPAPTAPVALRMLDVPAPRLGLAWSASNPAGFVDDIEQAWTQFGVASHGQSGSYRSKLQPPSVAVLTATLKGWRRIGSRSAVIGRVAVERSTVGAGDEAILIAPDPASPFVPSDTNAPQSSRTRVTLEGAQSIQFGVWRVGIALGYEGMADHAEHSTAAIVRRAASGGATLGFARTLGRVGTIGVAARHISRTETANVFADPRTVRVYPLDGLVGVDPQDYSLAVAPFFRRVDRQGDSFSINAASGGDGVRWSSYASVDRNQEGQISVISTSAPVSRWRTTGFAIGGVAARTVHAVRALVSADFSSQRGDADRSLANAGPYAANASAVSLASDVRWTPIESRWSIGMRVGMDRDYQHVEDAAARATTDVTAWQPQADLEIVRRVNTSWSWSAGFGTFGFAPNATFPSPMGRSAAYQELIAPMLEISAATARTSRASVSVRGRRGGSDIVARVVWSATSAVQRAVGASLLPSGSRSQWAFLLLYSPAPRE
jgi:hypothetical protein